MNGKNQSKHWRRGLPLVLRSAFAAQGLTATRNQVRVSLVGVGRTNCGHVPSEHLLMTWPVPHAAECITKYLKGPDGETRYHRLMGKPIGEETFEYGEQVMYRKRKAALKDLEPHWLPATWLGRRWGTHIHILRDGTKALEAYAV